MNILCIGDIVGRPGRNFVKQRLKGLIETYDIQFVVANGENSAGGFGITESTYNELLEAGADIVTLGNHTWDKKEVATFIEGTDRLIRPANYPAGTLGKGYIIIEKHGKRIAVVNINGRVFMECLECPFKTMDAILEEIKEKADIVIVDFHAEATSEKQALGWYLDGRVTVVFGTHTHVQTSDERILPGGTAYITDIGMTGPRNSVLGVDKDIIVKKFVTMLPARFEIASGEVVFGGMVIKLDEDNKVTEVIRLNIVE